MAIEQRIGRRAAEARRLAGLTQEQLAEQVGVSVQTVGRLERGEQAPPLARLEKIAEALGVDLADLMRAPARQTRRERALERLAVAVRLAPAEEIELVADLAEAVRRRASTR